MCRSAHVAATDATAFCPGETARRDWGRFAKTRVPPLLVTAHTHVMHLAGSGTPHMPVAFHSKSTINSLPPSTRYIKRSRPDNIRPSDEKLPITDEESVTPPAHCQALRYVSVSAVKDCSCTAPTNDKLSCGLLTCRRSAPAPRFARQKGSNRVSPQKGRNFSLLLSSSPT